MKALLRQKLYQPELDLPFIHLFFNSCYHLFVFWEATLNMHACIHLSSLFFFFFRREGPFPSSMKYRILLFIAARHDITEQLPFSHSTWIILWKLLGPREWRETERERERQRERCDIPSWSALWDSQRFEQSHILNNSMYIKMMPPWGIR